MEFPSIVLGSRCCHCRRLGPVICGTCRSKLEIMPGDFVLDGMRFCSAGTYSGVLRSMILEAKRSGDRRVITALAEVLRPSLSALNAVVSSSRLRLVPIPASDTTRFAVGCDLATAVLAAARPQLGDHVERIVVRTPLARAQKQRSASQRELVRFRVKHCVVGDRALLVDDVATTGSSLRSAARLLGDAGVTVVGGFVLARTTRVGESTRRFRQAGE